MRTGIYVYQQVTVSFSTCESNLMIAKMGSEEEIEVCAEPVQLQPGVYRVMSEQPLQVCINGEADLVVAKDKDDWPEPPTRLANQFSYAVTCDVNDFFLHAQGI